VILNFKVLTFFSFFSLTHSLTHGGMARLSCGTWEWMALWGWRASCWRCMAATASNWQW